MAQPIVGAMGKRIDALDDIVDRGVFHRVSQVQPHRTGLLQLGSGGEIPAKNL